MKLHLHQYIFVLILLVCCWLISGSISPIHAQMTATINSLADDADAHPWDDPDTPDIDESVDGKCEDLAHRCTLRAALEEAASMNNGIGVPCIATITVAGNLTLGEGTLYPTDSSTIKILIPINQKVTIVGGSTDVYVMWLGNNTTIQGINFSGGQFTLIVNGKFNNVFDCTFENPVYDAIDVTGSFNVIGGKGAKGNWVGGALQNGILVSGNYNAIQGNSIGMFGSQVVNNGTGIFITGSNNVIGGALELSLGNTICANSNAGISLAGERDAHVPCKKNLIMGNYIGTNEFNQGVGNDYGIEAIGDSGTLIQRNVICNNKNAGILIGYKTEYDLISYNFIGSDSALQYKLPNNEGINLGPGSSSCEVYYNEIRGNTQSGIAVVGGHFPLDNASHYHIIYGNIISLNGEHGIFLGAQAQENIIGSSLTADFYPNKLQRNGQAGVAIASPPGFMEAIKNTVRKNSFLDNGKRGIIEVNSQDDINPPTLLSYHRVVGLPRAVVVGSDDRPDSRIDFYTGEKILTNHVEGRRWLDDGTLGPSQTDFNFTIPIRNTRYILATATDANGNTSEFSDSLAVSTTRHRRFRRGTNSVSMSGSGSSSPSSSIPGASGSAYAWSGGSFSLTMHKADRINSSGSYVAVDTLVSGVGYWIKCDNAAIDSVTEFLQIEDTIEVVPGWNFIGSVSDPVPVSHVASIPDGMVTSQFFGYDTSYHVVDTIQPGQAYWVKVNQAGSLILASLDSIPPASIITVVPDTSSPPDPPSELSSVKEADLPSTFFLSDAYPNPFNPTTTIRYELPRRSHVVLKIYDLLGRTVATLVDEQQEPGYKAVTWNPNGLASGVYFYSLAAGEFRSVKKLMLAK